MSKVSKFTHLRFEIETPLWLAFKQIAYMQGFRYIKDAFRQAIIEYIENHQTEDQKIEVKIIKDIEAKENLSQWIFEMEIKHRLKEIIEKLPRAKKNPELLGYIKNQKIEIMKKIEKNPVISKELAEQIKTVFQNLS